MRPRPLVSTTMGLVLCAAAIARAQTRPIVLTPSSPSDSIALALDGASFVFTARVQTLGATTTHSVSPTHSVVVQVRSGDDTMFVSPSNMRSVVGTRVTIVLDSLNRLSAGSTVLFFARGLAADEGIALLDLGHLVVGSMTRAQLTDFVTTARQFRLAKQVQSLSDHSSAVVIGKVDSIGSVARSDSTRGGRRRHWRANEWREALVHVQRTFKGSPSVLGTRIRVLFRPGGGVTQNLVAGRSFLLGLNSATAIDDKSLAGIDRKNGYVLLGPSDVRLPGDSIALPRTNR